MYCKKKKKKKKKEKEKEMKAFSNCSNGLSKGTKQWLEPNFPLKRRAALNIYLMWTMIPLRNGYFSAFYNVFATFGSKGSQRCVQTRTFLALYYRCNPYGTHIYMYAYNKVFVSWACAHTHIYMRLTRIQFCQGRTTIVASWRASQQP